ncbi:MAG: ATP-dependent Clp protease ATP-binding subunit ClpX, partial [Bacteroidetes bacterium]|nr:ATP-dependent Clp protease ATP-binding subunit ClpX [Bacteroidota bacterium]
MAKKKEDDRCSFCGRNRVEVKYLLSGIDSMICESCVDQAFKIINEDEKSSKNSKVEAIKLLKPAEIKAH